MRSVAIFGAGIAGLAAARKLSDAGYEVSVYEKEPEVGGLARSHQDEDGVLFDRGPHYFFTTLAEKVGIQDKCKRVPYYENIYYKGKYYSFPFGLVRNGEFLLSVFMSYLKSMVIGAKDYRDLGVLLNSNYGKAFTSKILGPLIEKWSGVKIDEISSDFGKRLLPGNLRYIFYSIIKKLRGYTEDYYEKGRYIVYPEGGMKTIFDKILISSNIKLALNSELQRLTIKDNKITEATLNGKTIKADYFVSSIPINHLYKISCENGILQTYSKYRYRGILIVYMKFKAKNILEKLWNWYPEKEWPFYRLSEQIKIKPLVSNSENITYVEFELGSFPDDKIWNMADDEIFNICFDFMKAQYNFASNALINYRIERLPSAYPILLKNYENDQRLLNCSTLIENLFLAGRTGQCKYFMLEESYDSGTQVAEKIIEASGG